MLKVKKTMFASKASVVSEHIICHIMFICDVDTGNCVSK